ncbi:LuxR C-terminal-related transcriptional regulator [Nocardioides sp. R-C-SC26]|uniref:helix-turn-helix transcriptional regulator n=1 Tax=Nocardioides sp. R-C-SC26 TaxID=2870414 RepID=UPI0022B782E7|nr:LuxR C-terminal-related transcriptional regulator [Nocardioides sp. R-C-SC26]
MPPASPDLLTRPRLHAQLDRELPRLTVLSAPSGSGKTSLVRCWVDSRDSAAVAWLTLEGEQPGRVNFWQAVLTAAGRFDVLPMDEAVGLMGDVERIGDIPSVVAGALADRGQVLLVLDAFERLREDADVVADDLTRLVRLCPELRVVITTRTTTGIASPGRTLRGEIASIGPSDLAFTLEETRALLTTFGDARLADLAGELHATTAGFPLAVRAAMLSLARPDVDLGALEWRSLVADDLRTQLPGRAAYEFVLATCLPPYFDVDLADELSGVGDARSILAELAWHGFGRWIPFAPGRQVFQYVESLRSAMLAESGALPAATRARAAQAAAGWLHRNGIFETAFEIAVSARQYSVAGRVYAALVASNPEMITSPRFDRQLATVPHHALAQYPALALGRGLACHRDPALLGAAAEYFRIPASWTGPRLPDMGPGEVLMGHTAKVASLRILGRFDESARAAGQALAYFDGISEQEQHHITDLGATVLRHLSYSFFQDGQIDVARITAMRAIASSTRPESLNHNAVYAAGFNALDGRGAEARAALAHIDPAAWRPGQATGYGNALGRIGEAALCLDEFDLEGAIARYDGCAFVVTSEFWPFITWTLMHARLGLGRATAETHRVESALENTPSPPGSADGLGAAAVRSALAILWLSSGNRAKAGPLLRRRTRYAGQVAPAAMLSYLLNDDAGPALAALPRLEARPGHTTRSRVATLTLGSAAALRVARPDTAAALMDRVLALVGPDGARAHLMYLPPTDLAALRDLADARDAAALRAYLDGPVPVSISAETMPASLTPQESAVMVALSRHPSRAAVAASLHISENTVKTHLQRIYRKLGVNSREALIERAIELDLLTQ